MNKPHIVIERFHSTVGNTLFQVYFINDTTSLLLYTSPFKQGAYQNAHREAKKYNVPVYETIYRKTLDKNGIEHIIPIKNTELKTANG
jgi:hypothetical protein